MNIQPISQIYTRQNRVNSSYDSKNSTPHIGQTFYNGLNADTVSFTSSPTKLIDHVVKNFENDISRLERIATTFLDVLESVANGGKEKGISFDRVYCEANPVKSVGAYEDKIERSHSLDIRDLVRATLYSKDITDISSLTDYILPALKKRGYVLADIEMSIRDLMKRGYIPTAKEAKTPDKMKKVPDIDIRLNPDEITGELSQELRYAVSHRLKSGMGDIQMRLKREFDCSKKKPPVLHELIILPGGNTAKAKHEESERVYSFLRLFDNLNVEFNEDAQINSASAKGSRFIELIEKMFRGKISKKLFENAESKDRFGIELESPISFSSDDINIFNAYFEGLMECITKVYNADKKAASVSSTATRQLERELRDDKKLLKSIRESLADTINKYNYEYGLKESKA